MHLTRIEVIIVQLGNNTLLSLDLALSRLKFGSNAVTDAWTIYFVGLHAQCIFQITWVVYRRRPLGKRQVVV